MSNASPKGEARLSGRSCFVDSYLNAIDDQWLNSIGAQVIVEKWQSPEQWPNLYWLPLPEVDGHAQGGLVLLPAHLLPTSNIL